ncbi:MAG: AMP-binding protein [Anaeromyxobacteraceae bacterium]
MEASRHLVTIWTSGSTGAPLPHGKSAGQLLGEASLLRDALGVGPGCRVVATVPSLHIYGLLFGVLVPLAARGAFARESPLHAEAVAAIVRATAATHLVSTPAHLRGLLVLDSFPGTIRAFSSGAALADAVRAELSTRLGLEVTEVYGSTETGGIGVRDAMGDAWRPLPGVSVALDEEGCLVIDSPFLGRDVERPFPVGDRASLESGGFRLLGRADGVVKVAGKRVALAEVEARLLDVPGVTDAVAIAVPVAGARDNEILAVVAGAGLEGPAIRAALLRWLDPVSLPRRIRVLDRLPRGSGGKIPRDVVLALFQPNAEVLGFEISAGGPDAPSFLGHFDGAPVLPGYVQIIELVLAPARRRWPDLAGLRKVKRLKFRRPIVPGETLRVRIVRTSSAQRIDFEIMDRLAACSSGTLEFGAPP